MFTVFLRLNHYFEFGSFLFIPLPPNELNILKYLCTLSVICNDVKSCLIEDRAYDYTSSYINSKYSGLDT